MKLKKKLKYTTFLENYWQGFLNEFLNVQYQSMGNIIKIASFYFGMLNMVGRSNIIGHLTQELGLGGLGIGQG